MTAKTIKTAECGTRTIEGEQVRVTEITPRRRTEPQTMYLAYVA
jgi:hypothetical protein